MPKVSVLTTVYNGAAHIRDAVESVLSQDYPDFEMVIVNDGSTDDTASILQKFDDSRIELSSINNIGRPRALNYGVSKCKGEYIAILDADDLCMPGRLGTQAAYLDDNPLVGLVGAAKRISINADNEEILHKEVGCTTNHDIRQLLSRGKNPLFHSSVMFRKTVFEDINGYDESLACLVDLDFYVRAASITEIENLPYCFAKKRVHEGQYFGWGHVHKKRESRQAKARILARTTKYLGATKINLLKAVKMYCESMLIQGYKK